MIWQVFVHGKPKSKARPRRRKDNPAFYMPRDSLEWQQSIATTWFDVHGGPLPADTEYAVLGLFYFPDRRWGDLDNLLGAVTDAHVTAWQGRGKVKIGVFPNDRHVRLVVGETRLNSSGISGVHVAVTPFDGTSLGRLLAAREEAICAIEKEAASSCG